jgi:hypothetical protein
MPHISEALQDRLVSIEVDPAILDRWPQYRVLAIVAEGLNPETQTSQVLENPTPLDRAEALVRARAVADWTSLPHIAD